MAADKQGPDYLGEDGYATAPDTRLLSVMSPTVTPLCSSRTISPLRGAADSGDRERVLHDATFAALRRRGDSWRVFGEVPTSSGIVDLVAVRFIDTSSLPELISVFQGLDAVTVSGLSSLRRGVGYRVQTLQETAGLHEVDELLALGILRYAQGLFHRSHLPSDFISTVEAFEVKASSYSMGAVQAALRSEIAHQSWLVVPSAEVYHRLGARSHALIDRLGIGVVSPLLGTLRAWTGVRRRPKPALLNLLIRSVLNPNR